MIRFFRRFVFSFNIVAIILLGGSYLSAWISPKEAWFFALLGLAYPFILFLNILFAMFWLLQFKLKGIFSIAIILLGIQYFNQTFQFEGRSPGEQPAIRIISYNAGLFGYFQSRWHVKELEDKTAELKPQVLCVQEFLNINGPKGSTVDSIMSLCGFKYKYFQKLEDGRKRGEYGMAIFSNYEIVENGLVHFDGLTGNMCIYADLKMDTSIFRIYNVHLQSFKFKKQDYKFIEQMPEDHEEKLRQSKGILNRMKSAYIMRAEQVEQIRKHIITSGNPHFVIGDFNDPPMSYSYAVLSKGLRDAFMQSGSGMGKTYIGIMPNFRIDYILFPYVFEGIGYNTYHLSSDHSLVSAALKLRND